MSRIGEILKRCNTKLSDLAGKFFTPQEYKAALIFLGLGLAVILYRGGKAVVQSYFPSLQTSIDKNLQHKNDSIFAYLSKQVEIKDSLDQSMPEDSIAQSLASRTSNTSEKEKSLTRHSIALNDADSNMFQRLPGVGAVTARRIVLYRSTRGKFRQLKELMNVDGIGEGKFKKMEPYLRLD